MALRNVDLNTPGGPLGTPATRIPSDSEALLSRLDRVLGPRYPLFVVLLALLLAVPLALGAYLQGGVRQSGGPGLWMLGLDPAILVYILVMHPFMHLRWVRAMQSLENLAQRAGGAGPARTIGGHGEWVAMVLGAIAGFVVARHGPAAETWLWLYSEAVSGLMFAMLAAGIYSSMVRSRELSAYLRSGIELKVFDGHLLTPFAQWGQSVSLVFVGGISVSLLFQSPLTLRSADSIVIYGALVLVALTLFFMSMWAVHVALTAAQDKELARVRRDLAVAREALERRRGCEPAQAVYDAYSPVAILGIYERQVLDASTWPFNLTIVGRVFASAAAPLGVYLLKLAFGVGSGL